MVYNLSLIDGGGLQPLTQTVNEQLMFGWYGVGILITIFTILTLAFMNFSNDPKKSLGISSFISAILSIFMRSIYLLNDSQVLIAWLICGIVILVTFFQD